MVIGTSRKFAKHPCCYDDEPARLRAARAMLSAYGISAARVWAVDFGSIAFTTPSKRAATAYIERDSDGQAWVLSPVRDTGWPV
jgi:hypothetical protein